MTTASLQVLAQHKPDLLNAHKPEPFIKPVGMRIIVLRVEHNAQHFGLFEKLDSLAHQAHTNALAACRRMYRDAHQVTKFAIQRIELIANHLPGLFCHHKVRMGRGNILERDRVIAPEILETGFLNSEQRGHITSFNGANLNVLIAGRGDTKIEFIISVEQAMWLEVSQ